MTRTSAADTAGPATLAAALQHRAGSDPNLPAVKQGDTILTFAALDAAVARFATVLARHEVAAGDRVALIMPNVAYFPIAYYAILRLGAVVVPMNPLLKSGELAFAFADSGARVVVAFAAFAEEALKAMAETGSDVILVAPGDFETELAEAEPHDALVERAGSDPAVILYTSGTTGRPKGAELSQANLLSNAATSVQTLFHLRPGDVVFGGLPLFHSFGQTGALNTSILAGACLTLLPRFDGAEALRIVQADRVTVFMGVPTMYIALLATPQRDSYDTSSVRLGVSGGASLPVDVLHGVEDAFGFPVLEGYGLSETSPVAAFNHPDRPAKPGSVGTPIRGVEFALRDEQDQDVADGEVGEIVVRGENLMKGYWNQPEATAEAVRDGWFHTGDLARRDADGYYFIVDRKKDLILRNGFNVYPREVEEVLYTHPAVAEAAVFGVPDPTHGEEIAAIVTLKAGASASEDELKSFVQERIAAYKYPRIVRFGPLPKGPTGKILKRELRIDG